MQLPTFLSPFRRYYEAIGGISEYAAWLARQEGDNPTGIRVDVSKAVRLSWAFACIFVLSQTLARIPFRLMLDNGKGLKPQPQHPLYALTAMQPNMAQTPFVFHETLEAQRQGWGNAYAEIEWDGPFPRAMQLLMAHQVQTHYGADGSVMYLVTDDRPGHGGTRWVMANDMIHVPRLGFNGIQGLSPVSIGRDAIALGLAGHEHGARFFRRGGAPKGIIETKLSAKGVSEFADVWESKQMGVEDSSRTPILPKDTTFKPTFINPDDAQAIEMLKLNRTETCGLWRVPPIFVQDLEFNTYTNAAEQDTSFLKHTMMPNIRVWEQEYDRKLLTMRQRRLGYCYRGDVDEFLKTTRKERYMTYHLALQDGWKLRSEVREEEGDEPVDGMDVLLTPSNMVRADAADDDATGTGDTTGLPAEPPAE